MMKINKIAIVLGVIFSVFTLSAQKQDSLFNKNVSVTKEFQPEISPADKIVISPKVVEPTILKSKPVYSNISTPLMVDTKIQTLPARELMESAPITQKGLLRLGLGLPGNSLADFMYPILTTETDRLDVNVKHFGLFGDKKHINTGLNVDYNHLFDSFDLYANVGGSHDFFNYYGRSIASETLFIMSDIASQFPNVFYKNKAGKKFTLGAIAGFPLDENHLRFNTKVGVRSLPLAKNATFDANLNYRLFDIYSIGLFEHQTHFNGNLIIPHHYDRIGLNLDYYNFVYSEIVDNNGIPLKSYNLVKINPFIQFNHYDWFLKLGAKTGIAFGGAGQIFTPSADVNAQWNVKPNVFAIYGGVTGDVDVNSMDKLFGENKYLFNNFRVVDTYTPVDAYAGVKISPIYNLLIDFYGQYQIINNQYFFVNSHYVREDYSAPNTMSVIYHNLFHNRFETVYSRANVASVGLRTSWDYKNIANVYLKGAYHHWDVETEARAWNMPDWEMDFGGNVKVTNEISIHTQFIFQNGRYAKLSQPQGSLMQSIADWSIGGNYVYDTKFSFFLKLNNILNRRYEIIKGYDVQGINALAGVSYSF